jgi:small subunit ribosomal protein S16
VVKIRLKRIGTKKRPYYRIVVMDSRKPRDGRTIEEIGYYHPIEKEEKQVVINSDKLQEWMSKGAQMTPVVKSLFNRTKTVQAKQ